MLSEGRPVVVVLADQNFPPSLPARNGDCCVIIRVEDGLLHELEGALLDRFKAFLSPHGNLSTGSVILIGSISHLGARGLADYANALVNMMDSVANRAGTGVRVLPLPGVPLAGVTTAPLVRAMIDFDCWLGMAAGGPAACQGDALELK
jgi:hypothetical protein